MSAAKCLTSPIYKQDFKHSCKHISAKSMQGMLFLAANISKLI